MLLHSAHVYLYIHAFKNSRTHSTRLRARAVPDYDEKMALLHLVPLLFVLGDALLKDDDLARRHGMSERRSIRGIVAYGVAYFAWSCFCVFLNGGHWPYPVRISAIPNFLFLFLTTKNYLLTLFSSSWR